MSDYYRFDQDEKLGPPPWSGPALDAWEAAHGHDVRLKCYVEFGCLLIEAEVDRLRAEVERLRANQLRDGGTWHTERGYLWGGKPYWPGREINIPNELLTLRRRVWYGPVEPITDQAGADA